MMQLTKVQLTPYVVELWIVISDNPVQDAKKINKKYPGLDLQFGEDYAAWTNDHFYEDNILGLIFGSTTCDPDTVAHEAVHVLTRTFKHAGVIFDVNNDEHPAYMLGWIVGEIHKAKEAFIKKQQKQKKNGKQN